VTVIRDNTLITIAGSPDIVSEDDPLKMVESLQPVVASSAQATARP
jgi:hypothetical protein